MNRIFLVVPIFLFEVHKLLFAIILCIIRLLHIDILTKLKN